MKTMKKLLCTLLVVVMCLTSAPLDGLVGLELLDFGEWFGSKASATETYYREGYYTYTVIDGKAIITDVDESISGKITIPSEFGEYDVTTIGGLAFYGCTSLTNVIIPASVTTIGDISFSCCSNLTSITIPNSVTKI